MAAWSLSRHDGANSLKLIFCQGLFLVPLKGGRCYIIPQLAVYTTYIIYHLYIAFWGVICHLPPFRGTRNNHWFCGKGENHFSVSKIYIPQTLHVWNIYVLHENHKFRRNVGKYTSPMEHRGYNFILLHLLLLLTFRRIWQYLAIRFNCIDKNRQWFHLKPRQNFGPLLKLKPLGGYINNPAKNQKD